jgi:TonB family protein
LKNYKLLLLVACLFLGGCFLFFSGPSSVVKKFIASAESGDVDAMVSLWSSKSVQEQGADKLRDNARGLSGMVKNAREEGEKLVMENLRETINGDRARVFFIYRDSRGKDSVGMGFALIKEDGKWKLYRVIDIGEAEQPFDSSFATKTAPKISQTPEDTEKSIPPPPAPPVGSSSQGTNSSAESSGAPISGGELNSKAISLPQPAYPAVGKAVKASGKVVVQVTVDESGKVISATAVSGHPLLRAGSVAAAFQARFKPTLLSGKPVKVNGTLSYEFSPQ